MYALYKQVHPPTAVERCIYCNFFNSQEKALVVCGVNYIKVFRLNREFQSHSKTDAHISTEESKSAKMKMEFVQGFQLFGNIIAVQSVRLVGYQRDALLLSFQEAKLSVVEYDSGTHDLKTLSMHYFEDEELKDGHTMMHQLPILRADPDDRCAAMVIYGCKIVILPFKKDIPSEDTELLLGSAGNAPVLASYTINAREFEERMDSIVDMQFLYGYYEPTLLILFEPSKTWAGRVAVRQDTYAMVAISLNIQQKVHPVIWSVNNLPFDCSQVLAVPKPIGGVLIFAVNSLLYLNQSVPPFGVSLNSMTDSATSFPLRIQENIKITLDCAQATFIENDRLVISLHNGELYVVTLIIDGMRSVRSFNFEKAAASVLSTCICACEEGYLFLGSRLGNSLLLKYTEKIVDSDKLESCKQDVKSDDQPSKKRKHDNIADWMASDVALVEDLDELEVYGTQAQTSVPIASYVFEVCDSLLNIGPCGGICMGEPAFQSEEFSGSVDPDIELATMGGYGKNGALSVLQKNIRPQVVTTFDLPGCVDMWTVVGNAGDSPISRSESLEKQSTSTEDEVNATEAMNEEQENEVIIKENNHGFLILSRADSTMILQTGQEINELDHSGFSTQAPTVFAGNIGDNKYIIQVSPMGVRLLEGVKQLQHIPLDIGSPIVHATVADPYITIMGEEGQLILLTLRTDSQPPRLTISKPSIVKKSKILALCAYKDRSGLFTISSKSELHIGQKENSFSTKSKDLCSKDLSKKETQDDDDLLYGTSSFDPSSSGASPTASDSHSATDLNSCDNSTRKEINITFWLVVARENGLLEIYSLPDLKLAYLVKNFPVAPKVLVDSIQASASSAGGGKQSETIPLVKELLLVGLGHKGSRPILLSKIDDDIFLFEVFPFYETQTENHLKLRFRKIPHNMLLRERRWNKTQSKDQETPHGVGRVAQFKYFDDVAGYSGVFICGPYPYWLFLTSRGELRIHPMNIDGSVTSFSPFHNVNCPKGFLYFNNQGDMRICVLPTHLSYDASWPVRKVPLRCTPHFLTYHVESKTYCVVTSTVEPCNRLVRFNGDDKEYETLERDERFIYPNSDKFSVQLFSPVNWEVIPNTRFELEEWEHVTCLKNVSMFYEGARSGMKGYLVLGTNYNYGEDVTSRGRIIILDVIEVVPEPGQPLTKNRTRTVYAKEQKGPVTALCQVLGYLLSCIGQKVYVWQLKNNDLVGVAFIDTQIYIHSCISLKSLILVADVFKSISLLRFQDDVRTLSLVSRDVRPLEVYSTDFFIDNTQIAFLVSDVDKNLILYMYQPESRESFGGQRLIRRGDFHVGSHINSFFRIRCKLTDHVNENSNVLLENRHITMFSTLDGSLGYLLPLSEKTYRRLLMLQNVLTTHLSHYGGLNPKAYRIVQSRRKFLLNHSKNILDGDLLWKYISLSTNEKAELTKKIGTTVDQVYEDLVEIDWQTSHF